MTGKYNDESYKSYCVRRLMEISSGMALNDSNYGLESLETKSALDYVIGYLIGIGWADDVLV